MNAALSNFANTGTHGPATEHDRHAAEIRRIKRANRRRLRRMRPAVLAQAAGAFAEVTNSRTSAAGSE